MIVLRMAGKILLLPVWLLLATAHLLVKIAVEIYCIGKGIIIGKIINIIEPGGAFLCMRKSQL